MNDGKFGKSIMPLFLLSDRKYYSAVIFVRFGKSHDSYYMAEVGRWTAKDPILFESDSLNLYEYVGNDPINLIDMEGEGAAAVGLAGGLAGAGSTGAVAGGAAAIGVGAAAGVAFAGGYAIGTAIDDAFIKPLWNKKQTFDDLNAPQTTKEKFEGTRNKQKRQSQKRRTPKSPKSTKQKQKQKRQKEGGSGGFGPDPGEQPGGGSGGGC